MTEQLMVQPNDTDESLLRPIHAATPEALAPAGNDGSFLNPERTLDSFLGKDERPRIRINPETGLAYPIIIPSFEGPNQKPTRHHHNFPDSYLMGHALRHIYVQRVPAWLHNDSPQAIHQQFSILEELPNNANEVLGAVTMGLARHLPYEGLDLVCEEPTVRTMKPMERERISSLGTWGITTMQRDIAKISAIHMRWRSAEARTLPSGGEINAVHEYTGRLIMSKIGLIDNFHKRSRVFEMTSHPEVGFEMLRDAARVLVEDTIIQGQPLSEKYVQERRKGMLREDSPASCGDLLIGVLGTRGGLGAVFKELKNVTSQTRASRHRERVVA